jgi:predicted metal-dependent HD superfamily phosphohydrolase
MMFDSFQADWQGIGARSDAAHLFDQLVARYSEPHRRYHSMQHLTECIERFETVRSLAQHPDEVAIGLWFHDAIYEIGRTDNEEQSANWASRALEQAGVAKEAVDRVFSLVMVTRHTHLPVTPDEQLLVDIDLSILGAAPARFSQYEQQIREEYCAVPQETFKARRRGILQSFLGRPQIYNTAHFHGLLEERARANLQRSIAGDPTSINNP